MYEHSIIRTSVVTSITPYHIHDTFYDYVRYRIGVNCKCTGEGGMESRSNEPRGYALFILHSCFPYFPIDELCNFSSPLHQSDEFFPCRFPGKKLIFLSLHTYSRVHNSDPLSGVQARELILISMEACFMRFEESYSRAAWFSKESRVLNLRRKP